MLSSMGSPGALPTFASSSSSSSSAHPETLHTRGSALHRMHQSHVWIITGPAGSGKSTVGQSLAQSLQLSFIEGDDFHSPENKAKMEHKIPLTDDDRWDWLEVLGREALQRIDRGQAGAVMSCSALKRSYRDVIRRISAANTNVHVHFVYLKVAEAVLFERVRAREGHYMGEDMVRSQVSSLEEPAADEDDCLHIDTTGLDGSEVSRKTLAAVNSELALSRYKW